jgi:hypothetical protein
MLVSAAHDVSKAVLFALLGCCHWTVVVRRQSSDDAQLPGAQRSNMADRKAYKALE